MAGPLAAIAMQLALQYPPIGDPLVAEAVRTLGHPVQAQIDTVNVPYGANATAYRPGDPIPPRGAKKTDVNRINVNKASPYYKAKDLKKLAGLLAHEERHLGGGNESSALQTQMEALSRLGLRDPSYDALVQAALSKAIHEEALRNPPARPGSY